MKEVLFRGKTYTDKWEYGDLRHGGYVHNDSETYIMYADYALHNIPVNPQTVGQYTGLVDKNGKKIFEGDIVQYNTYDDFDCHSIVKFGEYKQDGSGGEYSGRKCIGFYVNVDNFTCPDWCDNEPECFPYHMWQQNILEVAKECEVIGNIYDNPELLTT